MLRYCLALDLKNDQNLIAAYEKHHEHVWPEIIRSIKNSGIHQLEIYRVSNRLFMIIEAGDDFTFEKKNKMDASNNKVVEWEELMWQYQQALPAAAPGTKWMLMKKIFML